jgi:uncharacterized membrane protein YGL010W
MVQYLSDLWDAVGDLFSNVAHLLSLLLEGFAILLVVGATVWFVLLNVFAAFDRKPAEVDFLIGQSFVSVLFVGSTSPLF